MDNIFDSIINQFSQNYSNPPQNPQDVANVPHQDVVNDYKNFSQNANPQQLYQAHENYYQQLPQNQRQNIFSELVSALTQHGINPQEAGVQNQEATPQNLANVSQYIGQNPNLIDSIFGPNGKLSSPLAKMALAGALAFAAKKIS
jgi:hypothetical protein